MKPFIFLIAALMLCESIEAATLMGGGVSTHLLTSDSQYTNTHDMIGVELGSVMAVRFRNSYGQESYAVAYRAHEWRRSDWRARLYLGGVRGYDLCEVCPAAVLTLVYDKYWVKPGVLLLGEALAVYVEAEL